MSHVIEIYHSFIKVLEEWHGGKAKSYQGLYGKHGQDSVSVSAELPDLKLKAIPSSRFRSYFQKSLLKNKNNPICPYGKDCFYSHLKEDGTPYVFKDGVDVCMKVCFFCYFVIDEMPANTYPPSDIERNPDVAFR